MSMDPSILQTPPSSQPQTGGKQPLLPYSEQLADFVNKEFEKRKFQRIPFELQWRLNMEFLNGNQYLDIDPETRTIMDVPRAYWYQEREVFNQIATITETRIARLSRQKPVMKVRPATSDQNDQSSAKVSSMLLNSTWFDEDMDNKYDKFIMWLEVTGTAFFKTVWNKDKGRVLNDEMQEKGYDELREPANNGTDYQDRNDGNGNFQASSMTGNSTQATSNDPFLSTTNRIVLREGDIDTDVCSCFEIYPDNSHGDFDDCRSVIHAKAYHTDDIEDWWGIKVEPEKVDVVTLQNSVSGMGGLGYNVGSFRYGSTNLKNHAVVKEYYELPSKKYPYGRLIISAGNKTLYAGVLPYKCGEDEEPFFPFVRAASIPVVGCFWGKSVIERCIPIQRRYNALRNRKAEYLNLVTVGQWYAPEGVVEDENVLNNEPGNIIRYRNLGNGIKPEPVVFPSLPSSFETEAESLLQEFTSVSGVSELSRFAEAPRGMRSGIALSIANEQDDTRISLTASQIMNASLSLGKIWLRFYRQFCQEPRLIRYVGDSSEIDVLYWEASDLKSDDVIIDNSTALAETPAQRRQMVFDLIGTGIFNRPETNPFTNEGVRRILEMLEFGYWESGVDDDQELQESKVKRENREMLNGQLVPVNDYDNDELHITEHYRFMMTTDYDDLMQTPEGQGINELFELHVNMHKTRMMQQQMQQQMSQIAMSATHTQLQRDASGDQAKSNENKGNPIKEGSDTQTSNTKGSSGGSE